MLVKLPSATVYGLETFEVGIEVNVASRGLPGFEIIGLTDRSIEESKHRIKTAIINSGSEFPNKKITVNLAPGNIHKEGTHYDLPIAVGIFCASRKLLVPMDTLFLGELSLDGGLREVTKAFLFSLHAQKLGINNIFVPEVCRSMFQAVISNRNVQGVAFLYEILTYLRSGTLPSNLQGSKLPPEPPIQETPNVQSTYTSIVGHSQAKRALVISCAGSHNLFFYGPPGSGKTLLAKSAKDLLPALTTTESIEVSKIYSVAGKMPKSSVLVSSRPFRSPHHTVSYAGMVGGGSVPVPGEVTLAHRGVLFMDEFTEFQRPVIEALRQPMEDGLINIVRSRGSFAYPAKFMLIAATNLCPCGNKGSLTSECRCTKGDIDRYQRKMSGPILDRFDLFTYVLPVDHKLFEDLSKFDAERKGELRDVRCRVVRARKIQEARFCGSEVLTNAEMNSSQVLRFCTLSKDAKDLYRIAVNKMGLSTRGYLSVLKIARTIADLDESEEISLIHATEALQFRRRENF